MALSTFWKWLRSGKRQPKRSRASRWRHVLPLHLERLEDRTVPTGTIGINNVTVVDPIVGQMVSGTLNPGTQTNEYSFTGFAGERLNFHWVSGTGSGQWEVLGPANNQVGGIAPSFGNDFKVTLPSDGLYDLALIGEQTAAITYSFQATDVSDAAVALSGFNTPQTGTLANNSNISFTFTASAGRVVYYDSLNNNSNMSFTLTAPDTTVVMSANAVTDTGPVALPRSGTYTLKLSNNSGSSQTYDFRLLDLQTAASALTLGTAVSATSGANYSTDVYTFTGTAGHRLYYNGQSLSAGGNTYSTLYGPGGVHQVFSQYVAYDNAPVTLGETGTYYLFVSNNTATTPTYNFNLSDLASAPTLNTAGGTTSNASLAAGHTDLYTFTGTAGERLFFSWTSASNGTGQYYLYGPGNQYITQTSFGNPLDVTLSSAGTYVLALNNQGSAAIPYTFQAATPPTPSTAITQTNLTNGDTFNGNLAQPGEIDSYTFTGSIGQRLYFNAISGWQNTIYATMTSPTGATTPINGSPLYGDVGPFTLTEAGTYTLKIYASGQHTGTYSFRLQDLAAVGTLNTSGGTTSNASLAIGHTDLYTFTGTAGERLFFSWTSAYNGNGTFTLYGPGNQQISGANVSFGQVVDVTLPEAGTYVLALNNYYADSAAIPYTFQAATPPLTSTAITQANLNAGTAFSGNLAAPGQIDSYTFAGTVGQLLYLNGLTSSSNSNITATLTSPTGAATAINGQGLYADVGPFTLTEAGTYTLKVRDSGQSTGAYSFRLQDLAAVSTLNTSGGTTSNASLAVSHTDLYTFTGTAGERLFFSWTSASNGNGTFTLYGPGNQYINSNSFGSYLDVTLPEAGTYVLALNNYYGNSVAAAYTFQAATPPLTSTTLTQANLNAGMTFSGNLAAPGEIDSYTFAGTVGQRLYFDSLSNAGAIYATMTSPTGVITGINIYLGNGDEGPFTLTEAGTYTLKVYASGQNTGAYSFRLQDVSGAPILNLTGATGGTLTPGTKTDLYTLTGTAGQRLSFTWTSSSNGSYTLYGPDNQSIGGNSFGSNLQVTLPSGGLYVLALAGSDTSNPVTYNFTAADDSDAAVTLSGFNTTQTGSVAANSNATFTFTASAGRAVYYDSLSNNGNLSFTLTAAVDGTVVMTNNAAGDTGPVVLPRSGTYTLKLTNNTGSNQAYSFRLLDLQTFATAYTLGNTISATSAGAYADEVFSFTGTVGHQLFMDGLANNAATDERYVIYGPGGEVVSNQYAGYDDGPRTLTESGTYYVFAVNTFSATPAYSFRVLDLASATALTLSPTLAGATTTSGTLPSPGTSANLYSFSGTAGEIVDFKAVSGSGGTFYLYGPTNQDVLNAGFGSDLHTTLPVTGTYTLVAAGYYYNTAAVSYSFQALAPATNTAAYTLGATQAGNIATPGQVDNYTFTGSVGQRLYFNGLTDTSVSQYAYVKLTAPSGLVVFLNNYLLGHNGPYTLAEAGTYTLTVFVANNTTGTYSFQVMDLAAAATALTLSPTLAGATTTSGTLPSPGTGANVYSFSGTAGEAVYFKAVSGANGSFYIYGPTNQDVFNGTFGSDFRGVLPVTATYYLVAAGYYYNTAAASYSFQALAPVTSTAAYTLGATQSGNLATPGQVDDYTFTGSVGQRLYLNGLTDTSVNQYAYVRLYAPSGAVVFANYLMSNGDAPITLPEAGTYTVSLTINNNTTGSYSFKLLDLAAAATAITLSPTLAGATTTSATLPSPGTGANVYSFSGTAGEAVYFKAVSGANGSFYIYGPTNQDVFNGTFGNDFHGVLPVTATYYLVAEGYYYNTAAASYSFQALAPVTSTTAYTLGAPQSGTIATPGQTDDYTFTGTAGQRVYFDGLTDGSSGQNTYVRLTSPSGLTVLQNYLINDGGPVTLAEAGTYTLAVTNNSNSTGSYSFRILDEATQPEILTGAVFTLTLSQVNATPVTVNFATQDHTAIAGTDYVAANGTVVFNPGETTESLKIFILPDTSIASSVDFYVNLSSPSLGTTLDPAHSQGVGTIINPYPTANGQSVIDAENTAKAITLTGTAPNGDPVTYAVTVNPTHGTLSGTTPNLTYTPSTNYTGSDSFQFTVTDTTTGYTSNPAIVNITVAQPPTANPQSVTTALNTAKAVTLTGTAPNGDSITFQVATNPAHGALSGTAPNLTYTPTNNYTGADSFTFTVTDTTTGFVSSPATVSITVSGAPTANGQSVIDGENTAKAITLTGSAPNGDALSYTVTVSPAHGALSGTAPNLTFTPTNNYTGSDSFQFTVTDMVTNLTSSAATVGITVVPPPVANNQSVVDGQNTAKAITLTGTDPNGDSVTYAVSANPAHGTLSGAAPNLTYTPNNNYTGADSFTFTITDTATGLVSNTGTISVTVAAAPVANNQSVVDGQNTAKAVTLTGSAPNGDAFTFQVATGPAHGALSGTAPNLTYTPTNNYTGADSFTFTVTDTATGLVSNAATVSISVVTAPTANAQSVIDGENTAKAITLTGTAPNGDPLTYSVTVSPAHGALSGTAPNLTFTPTNNYTGPDAFQFTVTDTASGLTSTASIVSITVVAPPVANNQSVVDGQNTAKAITLTGTDPNGDPVTYAVSANPAHGSLSGTAPSLTYTPNNNYTGADSFTFTITDTATGLVSNAGTISVTVVAAPTANAQTVIDGENTAKAITLTGSAPNGDAFTFQVATGPAHGALSGTAPNLTYTPTNNYTGADSFTFTVTDTASGLVSSAATVSITVAAPPVANNQAVIDGQNTAKAVTLTGSAPNGDPLTYTVTAAPAHGSLSGTAPNLTYTPGNNYTGADSFTFTITDTATGLVSNAGTISVTVVAPPVANNQSVNVSLNTAKAVTLTGNDPNGDPLTYAVTANPAHGALSGTAPNLTYTPNTNYTGADSFTFTITDTATGLVSNAGTISISVIGAPTANGQSIIDGENTAKAVTLSGTAPNGDPVTYAVSANPTHGSLSGTAPNLTYTPTAGYTGADSFQFTVTDTVTNQTSSAATVGITVVAPPVANNQAVLDGQNTAKAITLTGTDPNGDPISYAVSANPTHGTLSGTAPNLTYTPGNNYTGADSFAFTITDTATGLVSNAAAVTITVVAAPTANGQSVIDGENTAKAITLTGTDPNGDPITYAVSANPAHGTLSGTAPNLTYTPNSNFTGSDSFTFTITDAATGLTSNTATISVTVVPPPVANGQSVNVSLNTAKAITLTGTDPNGDPISYAVSANPAHGSLSGTAPDLTYTPNNNYTGADSFTFTITDTASGLVSNTGTISISVVGAPTANGQTVIDGENTAKAITLTGSAPNNDPLSYTVTVTPAHGTLSGTAPNLTYTPTAGYTGADSFQFTVTDTVTNQTSSAATVGITVVAPPVANNQAVLDGQNTAKAITLTGTDPNGDPISYAVSANPTHGTLSGTAPNLTYTPGNNYTGADSFAFTITDTATGLVSNAGTISVTVVAPPVANGQSVNVSENTPTTITLTNTDPNNDPLTYGVGSPAHGSLSGTAPNLTYTPGNNYTGADSFTFSVTDTATGLTSNTATISIAVQAQQGPTANDQSVIVGQSTAKGLTLTGSAPNGDPITFAVTANPAHGALSGFNASTGAVTYTPTGAYTGADSFQFTVTDTTTGLTSTAGTVTITVVAAPVANAQSVTAQQNTPTGVTLTGTDPNGDSITYAVSANPAHGTLSGTAPNLTYTPSANYTGGDSFSFTITDTATGLVSNTAIVSINVVQAAAATTYDWNGSVSTDWFAAANWTDVANSGHHAVPTAADSVVITGGNFATVLNGPATVAGLTIANGFLTLNGNLTDTGGYYQDEGFIGFAANGVSLTVDGNFAHLGGLFFNTSGAVVGNVVLAGTAGQTVTDTSGHALPNLTIANTSGAGVTLAAGSTLSVTSLTVAAGSALNLSDFTPGNAAAPVNDSGTLTLGAGSSINLAVGAPAAGATYRFIQFGTVVDNGAVFSFSGNGGFSPAAFETPPFLSVTLFGPTVFDWNGSQSSDWSNPANWTDATNGAHHAVPGVNDTAVITGGAFATVLSANATVANLQMANGFLTLNASLTDTGTFYQDEGFVAFGADADQLVIDGSVTRLGGVFLGSKGTVVWGGTAAQAVIDTSGHALPNLSVTNPAGVAVQSGSHVLVTNNVTLSGMLTLAGTATLNVGGAFTDNGTLNLSVPAPGNAAAPLVVGGTLTLNAGSVLNLTVGAPFSGATYLFIQFGSLADNGATFFFFGQGAFTPTKHENASALTVTLA